MTAQQSDSVDFADENWVLTAELGGPLFEPADRGIEPTMISTACWRGFACAYSIVGVQLQLSELMLGVRSTIRGKAISSTTRIFDTRPQLREFGNALLYKGLAISVPFSGGLLLGRDFIVQHYVHMGFHPAWKYEQVEELLLRDGAVTAIYDRSDALATIRGKVEKGEMDNPDGLRIDKAWVKRTFTLDYGRSLGAT